MSKELLTSVSPAMMYFAAACATLGISVYASMTMSDYQQQQDARKNHSYVLTGLATESVFTSSTGTQIKLKGLQSKFEFPFSKNINIGQPFHLVLDNAPDNDGQFVLCEAIPVEKSGTRPKGGPVTVINQSCYDVRAIGLDVPDLAHIRNIPVSLMAQGDTALAVWQFYDRSRGAGQIK